ncbi:MAG: ABC transporter ATP-binding protein [Planctomycetota bacterium]
MQATTNQIAVESRGVRKAFRSGEAEIQVLRGTDFSARFGEMTFLAGPSGCGKTTLISVLGGILAADDGAVSVLGEDLGSMRASRLPKFRLSSLGFVFQQFNLLPSLTAAENAAIPLVAQGMQTRKAEARATEFLERLGMGDQAGKMPNQLSGGQQQRVAIARALVHEPRLVICDEPTASLDANAGSAVMELLGEVGVSEERAVIIVTHDSRIFGFADRVHHMVDGTISKTETGQEAAEAGVL